MLVKNVKVSVMKTFKKSLQSVYCVSIMVMSSFGDMKWI